MKKYNQNSFFKPGGIQKVLKPKQYIKRFYTDEKLRKTLKKSNTNANIDSNGYYACTNTNSSQATLRRQSFKVSWSTSLFM